MERPTAHACKSNTASVERTQDPLCDGDAAQQQPTAVKAWSNQGDPARGGHCDGGAGIRLETFDRSRMLPKIDMPYLLCISSERALNWARSMNGSSPDMLAGRWGRVRARAESKGWLRGTGSANRLSTLTLSVRTQTDHEPNGQDGGRMREGRGGGRADPDLTLVAWFGTDSFPERTSSTRPQGFGMKFQGQGG